MEKRLIELETRLAFQDKTLEELNEVVTSQQQQLDRLAEELRLLTNRLHPLLAAAAAEDFPEA